MAVGYKSQAPGHPCIYVLCGGS